MRLSVSLIIVAEQHRSGTIAVRWSLGRQWTVLPRCILCQFKRHWQSTDLDNLSAVISLQVSFGSPCLPIMRLFFVTSYFSILSPVELLFVFVFPFSALISCFCLMAFLEISVWYYCRAAKATFYTTLHIFNTKPCIKNCPVAHWRIHLKNLILLLLI